MPRFDMILSVGVDQSRPAGKLGEFAHDGPGSVGCDRHTDGRAIMMSDFDVAGQDDGKSVSASPALASASPEP